jgi:hypothetical protein
MILERYMDFTFQYSRMRTQSISQMISKCNSSSINSTCFEFNLDCLLAVPDRSPAFCSKIDLHSLLGPGGLCENLDFLAFFTEPEVFSFGLLSPFLIPPCFTTQFSTYSSHFSSSFANSLASSLLTPKNQFSKYSGLFSKTSLEVESTPENSRSRIHFNFLRKLINLHLIIKPR